VATKNLNLKITADTRDAEKGFKKASSASDRFGRSVGKIPGGKRFSSIGKGALGAAAGFGAIAIAGNEISKSISTTIGLAKATRTLQRATGLAAEDASQLAAVLQQRGIDATKSGRAFTTLARQTRAAADGSESASKMFKELGVSQKAIKSGDVTAILTQASDGFNKLGDGQAKAAIAQQLFGKGAKDIIPLLEGGSDALREQLGLAPKMSQEQVKASLKMVGAQRELNTAIMGVRIALGTALMDSLSKGATGVAKFVTQMRTGKGAGGEFALKLKSIYESAKPALKMLLDVGKAVFNFAANNPGVVKLVASLAAVGLAIKAIRFTSKLTGISAFLGAGRTAMKTFKGIFQRIGAQSGSAAMNAAANSAANSAAGGVMTGGGRGAKFKSSGRALGKVMGKGIAAGVIAGIVIFGPELATAVNKWFEDNVPSTIKKLLNFGLGGGSPFGPGPVKGASRTRTSGGVMAAKPFGLGTEVGDAEAVAAARRAVTIARNKKQRERAQKALDALEIKQAAKQAKATAVETLKGFISGILEQIRETKLAELMAPVNAARAKRAADAIDAGQASLTTKIASAQNERDSNGNLLPGSPAALRYAREGATLDARIAQAKKQGNLDLIDQLEGEKEALDARYGPAYLKTLQDQLRQLNEDEIEASSEAAATAFAATFATGLQAALDKLFGPSGTVAGFFTELNTLLTGSGVSAGTLPASLTAGVGEAAAGVITPVPSLASRISSYLRGKDKKKTYTATQIAAGINPKSTKKAVFGITGKEYGGYKIANRASGGMLTPGMLTMVGETGPELIMGGKVMSSTRTNQMGGGQGMNITVNAVGAAADDPMLLARQLGWQLATR
jgi:hypothetical protein